MDGARYSHDKWTLVKAQGDGEGAAAVPQAIYGLGGLVRSDSNNPLSDIRYPPKIGRVGAFSTGSRVEIRPNSDPDHGVEIAPGDHARHILQIEA